jgi:copper transport protein
MRPRTLTVPLLGLLTLLALFATASPAAAHSELVASSPKAGSRLAAVPRTVTLTFSEAVDPAGVRVTAGATARPLPVTRAAGGDTRSVAVTLTAAKGAVAKGQLRLVWRAVDEEDGHATTGRLTFLIGPAPSTATPSPAPAAAPAFSAPTASRTVHDALLADRWLGYLCLALFLGGLAFVAALWPQGPAEDRRTRLLLGGAWTAGLLTSAAQIGLQGAYTRLGTFKDAFTADTYREMLPTDIGIDLAARTLLWVLAAVVLAAVLQGGERTVRSPGWRVGAAAVGLGLLRTAGMAGHNAEGTHPAWGEAADVVHLLGVSLWIGGLTMLLFGVLPRRRPQELASVVAGYSVLAATAVTAIVGAGAVLTWQVVGSWHALFATSYGHLLLVKIALLTLVLTAASRSRGWVRTRLDIAVVLRGDRATVRPFVYSVAAETGLVMAVLVAASYLVTANPGR